MVVRSKKNLNSEKGQALFEFIVFIPFMLLFYTIIIHVAGAINGSINQQKAVRGVFLGRLKGNPTVPVARIAQRIAATEDVTTFGMYNFIYSERTINTGGQRQPQATCYKIPSIGSAEPEDCLNEQYPSSDDSSPFVSVKTAFGVCGMTYRIDPNIGIVRLYNDTVTSFQGCLNLNL